MAEYDWVSGESYAPVRICDAKGREHNKVARCNTETGRIEKYVLVDGAFVLDGDHARTETIQAPAPLRIWRIDGA